MPTDRSSPLFGESLIAMTPEDPGEDAFPDSVGIPHAPGLHDAMATTPFVVAVKRLLAGMGPRRGVPVWNAWHVLEGAVRDDALPHIRRGAREVLLFLALTDGYVDHEANAAEVRIVPGPRRDLVDETPRYCWTDTFLTMLFCGDVPLWGRTRIEWYDDGLGVVAAPLYQYILKHTRDVDVDAAIDALHGEISSAAGPDHPAPLRPSIEERVLLVLEVLRIFGVVGPVRREHDGLRVDVTGLGLFAWVIVMAHIDGELSPEWDALARQQGYLPADGGYIAPKDVPAHIAFN